MASMPPVPRAQWGATAPTGKAMKTPVPKAWIHHTVTTATSDPVADVKAVEAIGVSRFGIMSYCYLYHPPTRTWYEGAGMTVGAHTGGQNSTSLGLSVIGNTMVDQVPHFAEDLADLLRWLQDTGRLAQGEQPTGGHRWESSPWSTFLTIILHE